MPVITIPFIPALFALMIFVAVAFIDSEHPAINCVLSFIASIVTFFAIYGLMKAVGL